MPKTIASAFGILISTVCLITSGLAFASTDNSSANSPVSGPANSPLEDPSYAVVLKTPLVLEAVSSTSVCGSVQSKPNSRQCVGTNSYEIFANDTVSKLDHFILGAGQLCGVDERGTRCWSTRGQFEKSVQEILSIGDVKRAQLAYEKICVPQKDNTIHCYPP